MPRSPRLLRLSALLLVVVLLAACATPAAPASQGAVPTAARRVAASSESPAVPAARTPGPAGERQPPRTLIVFAAASLTESFGELGKQFEASHPGAKLVVADEAVPVGQYTQDILTKMSKDPAYGADFADRVRPP